MAFIVYIGERMFPGTVTKDDVAAMASAVKSGLESKGTVTMTVDGTDPRSYIGGVSRSLASRIYLQNGVGSSRTQAKDEPNFLGVSDRSVVVFERY